MEHTLSRTASAESTHSWQQLMAGSLAADRKARSSEPETGGDSVGRASVSLPPSGAQAIRQLPQRRASKASDSILDFFGHGRSSNSSSSANGSAIDEVETTPTLEGTRTSSLVPLTALMLPDALRPPPPPRPPPDADAPENKRLSFSSLYSIGSAIYANTRGHSWSGRSSWAGSEFEGMQIEYPSIRIDAPH